MKKTTKPTTAHTHVPLHTKLKHSFGALYTLFRTKPVYLCIAIIVSIIMYVVLFWLNNLELLGYILTSPHIPFGVKLQLLSGTFTSIISLHDSWALNVTLLVSILQGAAIAALIFMLRTQRNINKAAGAVGQAGVAGLFAAVGLGCSACGTSLLTPVLLALGASSSQALSAAIGNIAVLIALIISIISLYFVGKQVSKFIV